MVLKGILALLFGNFLWPLLLMQKLMLNFNISTSPNNVLLVYFINISGHTEQQRWVIGNRISEIIKTHCQTETNRVSEIHEQQPSVFQDKFTNDMDVELDMISRQLICSVSEDLTKCGKLHLV